MTNIVVDGKWKNSKRLPPLRIPKLSKKEQDKEDEIKKNYMKLRSGGMTGNSNYIGTILNGLIQEVKSKGKTLFSFFNFFT